ncbi:branched-chain amino acid transport system II carrier protein [Metabacillus sp. GX 13764]|uniref:branched-chain amino acid transport system II carrier protein n=1 Tax=Metabacillus kandeliae TaxID=2900151 RepID=UPI001E63B8B3|nr:branched-chain amino acid transport system II carrier protein [Metabacillus kandeliae]MCD7032751.1 branched-chain amino acid transport system II carrier protein [Metabacillus kandeliae]
MKKGLTGRDTFVIGLMLFALFLGAGNLIFPPGLGQAAGGHVWIAIAGFLITGVGLPLLGVIAIGYSGENLKTLASRVHPLFAAIFTAVLYLAIGPFFGIPRTATVSFEIGIASFLPKGAGNGGLSLFIYSAVFFGITYWLALNPGKLVDRIGKALTPALLIVLGLLIFKSIFTPMGEFQAPTGAYQSGPFFKGFLDGYLTMDTLAALVFGIVVVNAVKDKGAKDDKTVAKVCLKAGLIAAAGLALVYLGLAYMGATSLAAIGKLANGGAILSASTDYLFGPLGSTVLSLAILFACLTTSVGLVSSCGEYFSTIIPSLSYKMIIGIITLFSIAISNFGLTQLISFSVPVLTAIYPLAIVLIILTFIDSLFKRRPEVYAISLLFTGIVSVIDGLKAASIVIPGAESFLKAGLPLYEMGIGWLIPAIAGAVIGYVLSLFRKRRPGSSEWKEARNE